MSLSFSSFCESLGVPLHNIYWSWCACSEERRTALFTVWEDRIQDGEYVFTTAARPGESQNKPGRKELISVLDRVVNDGYGTYGIQCRAVDINAVPRKRRSFIDDQLLDIRIRREGSNYIGRIVGHIPPDVIAARATNAAWVSSTAINDLAEDEAANPDPEYRRRMSGSYVRDNNVRATVLKRAKGSCEYCNKPGFKKSDGKPYLETHHVIALSEQGVDRSDNVIALCANDHRRAHFGNDWKELQDQFLEILRAKA
ncbi:MAG TPA: HNH endonuclease signature motif containing protein [Sphingomonadaceae bacterium]